MNDIEKNLKDAADLGKTVEILQKLYSIGEQDPLLMTDAEFNNFCSYILTARARFDILKKTTEKVDESLKAAEALVTIAKFVRGGMNNGSEN